MEDWLSSRLILLLYFILDLNLHPCLPHALVMIICQKKEKKGVKVGSYLV